MDGPRSARTAGAPAAGARVGDARRRLGRLGEELAAAHLQRLGFRVLERNVRTRWGEIDLIAFDGSVLAFVEVKTLRAAGPSPATRQPLAWPRARQRTRLRRLAVAWLGDRRCRRPTACTIRFDAIGILLDRADRLVRLEHLEGAW